jgi:hypothetical protein
MDLETGMIHPSALAREIAVPAPPLRSFLTLVHHGVADAQSPNYTQTGTF